MLRFNRRFFSRQVFPEDEEKTRAALLLHTLWINAWIISVLIILADIFIFTQKLVVAAMTLLVWIFLVVVGLLQQRGRIRQASMVIVSGFWLIVTLGGFFSGGMFNISAAWYVALVVVASLLLGKRMAFITVSAEILASLVYMIFQAQVHNLPVIFPLPAEASWILMVIALALVVVPLLPALQIYEEALWSGQQNKKRFRALFEQAPVMYLTLYEQGGVPIISGCNTAFLKTLGYNRDEATGQPLSIFCDPQSPAALLDAAVFQKALRNELKAPLEQNLLTRRGRVLTTLLQATPDIDEKGQAVGVLAMFTDISGRKAAEKEQRESEIRYRKAIEATGAVPYSLSKQSNGATGEYDFMGEGIRRITGYGPEEMSVKLIQSLVIEAYPVQEMAGLEVEEAAVMMRSGEASIYKCDVKLLARDGSMHWVFDASVAVHDDAGAYTGSIGMLIDITDRKKIEEELYNLNAALEARVSERTSQLEAVNKELESFTYSVTHDLRSPLRAINGYTSLLESDFAGQIPAEANEMLTKVRERVMHMDRLIDDLLNFSRLGWQPMNLNAIDPTPLVKKVWEARAGDRQDRQVEFILGKLPTCQCDPALLEVVWDNLLSNAIKYSRRRSPAHIEVGSLPQPNGETAYFVRDNGVGFNMEYAGKLFQVFQRMHSEAQFEGTGVGLALVKRIVNRHGGRIWAEAEEDRGAAFFFTIGSAQS